MKTKEGFSRFSEKKMEKGRKVEIINRKRVGIEYMCVYIDTGRRDVITRFIRNVSLRLRKTRTTSTDTSNGTGTVTGTGCSDCAIRG